MNLNQRIVSLLKKKKLKLTIAESCTGGMLADHQKYLLWD